MARYHQARPHFILPFVCCGMAFAAGPAWASSAGGGGDAVILVLLLVFLVIPFGLAALILPLVLTFAKLTDPPSLRMHTLATASLLTAGVYALLLLPVGYLLRSESGGTLIPVVASFSLLAVPGIWLGLARRAMVIPSPTGWLRTRLLAWGIPILTFFPLFNVLINLN